MSKLQKALFFSAQKKSLLPDGYTQLHWIESTGTQYIDTGYKPNQNTRVECFMSSPFGGWKNLFGTYGATSRGWNSFYFLSWAGTSGNMYSWLGNSTAENRLNVGSISNKTSIYIDKTATRVGNVSQANTTSNTFASNYNFILFGITDYSNAISYCSSGTKIYDRFTIYENSTLVRNFIPCYHKTSGEVGMYDLVSKTFFENDGTGTFTKGPDVI